MKIKNTGTNPISIILDTFKGTGITIAAGATSEPIDPVLMPPNRLILFLNSLDPVNSAEIILTSDEYQQYAKFMPPSISEVATIDATADNP